MAQGVFAITEQRDGELRKVSHEVVSEGRRLADGLGADLTAVVLGSGVEGHPHRQLRLSTQLLLERLRQGRHRLARGAGCRLSPDEPRRARLQSPWLPERRLLQPPDVRPVAADRTAEAGGRAWRRQVEADQLGPGADRDSRQVHRCHDRREWRSRIDLLGSRLVVE